MQKVVLARVLVFAVCNQPGTKMACASLPACQWCLIRDHTSRPEGCAPLRLCVRDHNNNKRKNYFLVHQKNGHSRLKALYVITDLNIDRFKNGPLRARGCTRGGGS